MKWLQLQHDCNRTTAGFQRTSNGSRRKVALSHRSRVAVVIAAIGSAVRSTRSRTTIGAAAGDTDRDEVSAADGAEDLVDGRARRDRAVEDVELTLEPLRNVVASSARVNHRTDHLYVDDVCELAWLLQVVETFHLHQLARQLVRHLATVLSAVNPSFLNITSLIPFRRRLQLRFDCDSTALRPLDDLRHDCRPSTVRPKWMNTSAWERLASWVTVTLMTFDKQSNGSRIEVES